MATSTIEWTEQTINPSTGCDKVSDGCDNCYALTLANRLKAMGSPKYQTDGDPRTSGPGFGFAMHPAAMQVALRRKKPTRWFVNSMSDLFHAKATREFLAQTFAVMAATPQHTYQILTKRPLRMSRVLNDPTFRESVFLANNLDQGDVLGGGWPLPNLWLGVSVEDQQRADERIPHLLAAPAAVRFLSCEPLLGPLDLTRLTIIKPKPPYGPGVYLNSLTGHLAGPDDMLPGRIGWVIVGGESGHGARPMHPDWVRGLRDQCQAAGVPFLFKQWGEYLPVPVLDDPAFAGGRRFDYRGCRTSATIRERSTKAFTSGLVRPLRAGDRTGNGVMLDDDTLALSVGKKAAGRELDGRTWDEYPAEVSR